MPDLAGRVVESRCSEVSRVTSAVAFRSPKPELFGNGSAITARFLPVRRTVFIPKNAISICYSLAKLRSGCFDRHCHLGNVIFELGGRLFDMDIPLIDQH